MFDLKKNLRNNTNQVYEDIIKFLIFIIKKIMKQFFITNIKY